MALVPSNGSALVPSSATPSASNALVPQGHYDLAMTQNANAHNSLQNITNNLGQAVQGFLGQQSQQNQVAQNNAWFNNLPQQHQNQLVPVNFQPVNTSQLVPSGWENIYGNQGQMVPSNPQNQGQIVPSTPIQQQNQGQVGFPNQEQGQIVPSETQPTQPQQPEQPTTENPAQEVVPSNPTQGTSAPRPTTLNLGSRTRKIKRKHGLRIQADGVIPDDEFNMDMIKLCEPCPDSGGHEQNCGRHAQKIIKQYEAMEFRTEIFDYMVKNKDNMTDGFVCTILNMENTFICEDKEMYELYREMRETRGMNKHYGTPSFEHVDFSNNICMAEVHTSCICAQMFENRGHCKECFVQWIEKVCMVALIFPLHHQLTRRMRKLARKQTRQNSFARQLQYVSVEAFCALDSLTFMNVSAPHLIAVRDELGVNKPNDEPWFAQADSQKPADETPTSWLEWLGFTTAIDWTKATLDNVKDLVKSAFEKLIKSMCDAATWARNLLSQWKERLVRILIDSFLEPTRQCFSLLLKKSVMALIGVICCLLLCFFGFITWDKICAFLGLGLDCLMTAKDCVMNIVTKIFEVKSEDILRYCKNAVIITSGLGAAFTVSSKIFGLLPFAIQAAVIDKVGTKGQKDRLMIDEWKARAYSILTVTRIPRIVSSKYYHEKLNEINEEGFRLLKYVERDRKLEVLQLYCRVQAAWTNLVVKHEAAKQRDLPFSIHISGAPGVGKTVMTSKLIESLGYTTKDVYYRPPASEFWDGFIGAKVVIYDEFLINSDTANQMATEYLNLVSIAPFSPPLASTDNIAVGVKGTTARPELVITINNAPCYAPPSLMSRDALLRRRNIVLQLNKNAALFQKYQADIMGNAPMVQMTKEEVDDAHWVNATLLDPMTGSPITQPMRIKTAFKVIGTYHETHEVVNMRLLADERADLTPDEIFQQVMKLHCGVPTQKFSLMAFLKDKVGSWVAQGKKSRPPKNQREAMKAEAKKEFENLQSQPHQTVPQGTQPDDVRDLMEAVPPQPLPSYPQGMIMPNQYYQSGVASYVASVAGLRDAPRTHAYGYETIVNNEFGPPGSSTGSYLTHMTTPSQVHSEPGYVHRTYPMRVNPNDPRFQNCATASDTEMDPKTAMVVNQREDLMIETENGMFIYDPHDTPPFHDARSPTHRSSPQHPQFNEQDQELDARIKALEPITEELVIDEAEKLQTSSQVISKWLFDAIHCTAVVTFSWTKECGIWFIEGVKKEPTTWFLMGWLIFLGYVISRVINQAAESDARITDAVVDYYSIPREAQDSHSTSKTTARARKRNVVRGSRWESQAQATMLGEIVISSGPETVNQYFVNIGKRWALTTAHIWDCMIAVNKVTLTYRGVNYSFELKDTDVALDLENDLGLFRVPHNNFPNTKDMTNRFATFDEITSINTLSATIERGNGTIFVMAKLMDGWVYSSFKNTQQPQKMFIYSGRFEGGDCGAILRSADTIASGKIIGIHVCGSTSVNVPKGGSTTICVSDVQSLKEAFGVVDADTDDTFVSQGNVCTAPIEPFKYPRTNLINISAVSPDDIVHFPVRSKITPSLIYGKLPVESEKQPSVMSSQDSRTSANPDENFKQRISQINRSQIDPIKLHAICATMIKNFKQNFVKKLAPRELTMEEAIGGIPGYLSSLKISTSPGFPVCKMLTARGKTACFMIYPEGKIEIEPWFRTAVEHRLDEMKRGVKPRNRFLVYFKDELVSKSKVEEARTRAIYCNDVVSLVAFRMRYGVTLAEFNNSNLSISSAVGLNQYSTDMHSIFHYLTCTGNRRFIAGDYKNFDTTYNRQIHKAAYDIFFALNEITSETENEYVWRHEGEEPLLQFKQELLRVFCMHTSGCFLTTVINCIVNEIYFRYIFMMKYPSKSFDKECRLKVLGDDHILSISDRVELNPLEIQSLMANIGLTYTSDRKDEDLTAEYRSFEEITFLGAHPRLIRVEGMMTYVGAPKQQMLWQSIQWTKTNNNDLMDVIEANLYLASLWDKDFFRNYYLSIKEAITNEGFAFDLKIPSYEEMQQIAATRNAASGETWFRAQGRIGLTQVVDENVVPPSTNLDVPLIFGNSGIQELPGTLDLGSDSLIHRFDLEWKITSKAGDTLIDVACPFDMLKYGQLENLQNMPFDRYLYARCDTEVVVQIAGTPFHQGALLVNIIPLDIDFAINANNATGYRYGTPVSSLTFFNHVILSPNTSTTATMKQPFIYFKDWLNTRLADNYCRFKLSVLSQLQVGDGGATSVSVSVFSRFPNLKVSVPRPQTSKSDKLPGTMLLVKPEPPTDDGTPEPERWVAQGNHISTNNSYNISNVAGSVPIGTSNQASAVNTPSTNIQANPNVSAIPMDNPPMCSGSIPVYSVFPSKAKTVGISTAVSLGHHPEEMHRQAHQMAAMNNDMSVEAYCARPTLLGRFMWSTTLNTSDVIFSVPFNSLLAWSSGFRRDTASWIPSCCYPLNIAQFWRADFNFTFMAVMSDFHSGRLRATVAYGCAPYSKLHNTIYRNEILDFTSGSEVATVKVPFNAPTEYLCSFSIACNKPEEELLEVQEFGSLQVSVANALKCPATVAQSVEVLVFVTCSNVKLREVRSFTPERPAYIKQHVKDDDPTPTEHETFVAQANTTTVVVKEEERIEDFTTRTDVTVDDQRPPPVPQPCRLNIGEKFEYTWNNFGEIYRRYVQVAYLYKSTADAEMEIIPIFPSLLREVFGFWSGHLQFRIIAKASGNELPEITATYRFPKFSDKSSADKKTITGSCAIAIRKYKIPKSQTSPAKTISRRIVDNALFAPVENLYPLSNGWFYIDVRVPFNTQYNFLPVTEKGDVGMIKFFPSMPFVFNVVGMNTTDTFLYMKASDDCRFFLPRPVNTIFPVGRSDVEASGGFVRVDLK